VRELENILGRALINMQPGEKMVCAGHLPLLTPVCARPAAGSGRILNQLHEDNAGLSEAHAAWEKTFLRQTMDSVGGNRTHAARLLKISVRQLYNKLKKRGVER
jgi:transcriptional regulator with PAS, ATPase and Fis domain